MLTTAKTPNQTTTQTSAAPAQEAFPSRPFAEQPLQPEHTAPDIRPQHTTAQPVGHHFGNIPVFPSTPPITHDALNDQAAEAMEDATPADHDTGLPTPLKAELEATSGYALDDVIVHYNSPKPARLDMLAYAQGTEIHLGPGQEHHLLEETKHVLQQKQGRVQPNMEWKGQPVCADHELEREAQGGGPVASIGAVDGWQPLGAVPTSSGQFAGNGTTTVIQPRWGPVAMRTNLWQWNKLVGGKTWYGYYDDHNRWKIYPIGSPYVGKKSARTRSEWKAFGYEAEMKELFSKPLPPQPVRRQPVRRQPLSQPQGGIAVDANEPDDEKQGILADNSADGGGNDEPQGGMAIDAKATEDDTNVPDNIAVDANEPDDEKQGILADNSADGGHNDDPYSQMGQISLTYEEDKDGSDSKFKEEPFNITNYQNDDYARSSKNINTIRTSDENFQENVQILSGHGVYAPQALRDTNQPQTVQIPPNTTFTMWLPHGSTLKDWIGGQIDVANNFDNLIGFYQQNDYQMYVYTTDDEVYNYHLLPGGGLKIQSGDNNNTFNADRVYVFQNLLKIFQGKNIHWAACADIKSFGCKTLELYMNNRVEQKSADESKQMSLNDMKEHISNQIDRAPYSTPEEIENVKIEAARQLLIQRIDKWVVLLKKLHEEESPLWGLVTNTKLKIGGNRQELYQRIRQTHSDWEETKEVVGVEEEWLERSNLQRQRAVDEYEDVNLRGFQEYVSPFAAIEKITQQSSTAKNSKWQDYNVEALRKGTPKKVNMQNNDDDDLDESESFEFNFDNDNDDDESESFNFDDDNDDDDDEEKKDEPTESEQDNKENRTNYTPQHPETIAQCLRTHNRQTIQDYLEGDYPNENFSDFTNLNIGDAQNLLLNTINKFGFPESSNLYDMLAEVADELY